MKKLKVALEKVFFLRHILFMYFELKRSFILRKSAIIENGNPSYEIFLLRFINPYIKKFKKNSEKKLTFKNEFSKNIFDDGYSILPKVDCDKIDFLTVNYDEKLQRTDNLVDVSKALDFAQKLKFNEIVKDYFKETTCNFTVTSWNTNPFKIASGITKWHQDRDGYKILKFFIYLKDTDKNNGAHMFAIKSHKKKFVKFIPQFRYEDNEVADCYENIITFCGPKGYCFAEDTSGLHKGTPPEKDYRSIIEYVFYTGKIRWNSQTKIITL